MSKKTEAAKKAAAAKAAAEAQENKAPIESATAPAVVAAEPAPDDLKDDPDAGEDIAEGGEADDADDDLEEGDANDQIDDAAVSYEVGQCWVNPEDVEMTITQIEENKVFYKTSEGENGHTTFEILNEWLKNQAIQIKPAAVSEENAQADTAEPPVPEALLGSDAQPTEFNLASGAVLSLGDVVREAFEESGLTVEEWNEQDSVDRETWISDIVDALQLQKDDDDVIDQLDDPYDGDAPDLDAVSELETFYGASFHDVETLKGVDSHIKLYVADDNFDEDSDQNTASLIAEGSLLELQANIPISTSADLAAAVPILPEMRTRWGALKRSKPLRVMVPNFEFNGKTYEVGELFDYANLPIKFYAVQRLYATRALRHVIQDLRVTYPIRPDQRRLQVKGEAMAEIRARQEKAEALEAAAAQPVEEGNVAVKPKPDKTAAAKKFQKKNAHLTA